MKGESGFSGWEDEQKEKLVKAIQMRLATESEKP